MIRFPPSPSDQLVFDALAGQEAFVEVVFDGAHFGDQVGEVREGQQPVARKASPSAAVVLPLPSPV